MTASKEYSSRKYDIEPSIKQHMIKALLNLDTNQAVSIPGLELYVLWYASVPNSLNHCWSSPPVYFPHTAREIYRLEFNAEPGTCIRIEKLANLEEQDNYHGQILLRS